MFWGSRGVSRCSREYGLTRVHDDVLDIRNVAPGGRGGLLRGAPALASVHVCRVPVPPVVRCGDRLEGASSAAEAMEGWGLTASVTEDVLWMGQEGIGPVRRASTHRQTRRPQT